MTTLMKCIQPHHQGDKYIPVGYVLPAGHPEVIDLYFEAYEIEVPLSRDQLDARAAALGIKLDRRKSDDTVRAEIAAAETEPSEEE